MRSALFFVLSADGVDNVHPQLMTASVVSNGTRDDSPCHHYAGDCHHCYGRVVPRWEPNAESRLHDAALSLFVERGYAVTTVADIAERAGLTERSYFRYFSDKREVLFFGSATLRNTLVSALRDVAPQTRSWEAVVTALAVTADNVFADRYEYVARRQMVIDAHPELQERELTKLDGLARDLAATLCARNATRADADLSAEAGMLLFKIAFRQWIASGGRVSLAAQIHKLAADLRDTVIGEPAATGKSGAARRARSERSG